MTASIIRRDRCCHDNSWPWAELAKPTNKWLHEWKKKQTTVVRAKYVRKERATQGILTPLPLWKRKKKRIQGASKRRKADATPWARNDLGPIKAWLVDGEKRGGLVALLAETKTNNRAAVSRTRAQRHLRTQRPVKVLQTKWSHEEEKHRRWWTTVPVMTRHFKFPSCVTCYVWQKQEDPDGRHSGGRQGKGTESNCIQINTTYKVRAQELASQGNKIQNNKNYKNTKTQ